MSHQHTLLLGVNVDHVATLRQARYALMPDSHNAEPSPLQACHLAQKGGADSITIHVRADRRHMQESDAFQIKNHCPLPLNLEMGVTGEMLDFALKLQPQFVCLVPETRQEITTEGGLDVIAKRRETGDTIKRLQHAGIRVSLFIDPHPEHITISAELGAEMIELHTGSFANASGQAQETEIEKLRSAAIQAHQLGLQVNAGHGINYTNYKKLFVIPHLTEWNIGHSIISRSITVGMEQAVREMKNLMDEYCLKS